MKISNESGQGLVEYLILVALMAVATLSVLRLVSHTTNAKFASIVNSLQGKAKRIKVEQVQESHYRKKDLGDFMNGAASSRK